MALGNADMPVGRGGEADPETSGYTSVTVSLPSQLSHDRCTL